MGHLSSHNRPLFASIGWTCNDNCYVATAHHIMSCCRVVLQYYSEDAFVVCTHGRLRVCLVPPQHALSGCYPFPTRHPYDRHPMVDFCAPDTASWPQSADVRGCTCVLRPGDALYVPRDWFFSAQVLSADAKGMPATLLRRVPGSLCVRTGDRP